MFGSLTFEIFSNCLIQLQFAISGENCRLFCDGCIYPWIDGCMAIMSIPSDGYIHLWVARKWAKTDWALGVVYN